MSRAFRAELEAIDATPDSTLRIAHEPVKPANQHGRLSDDVLSMMMPTSPHVADSNGKTYGMGFGTWLLHGVALREVRSRLTMH